jgi:fibronectin-binding autotransporter adhesin
LKRRYAAIGAAAGLGFTGLIALPQSAKATLPCGIYQNPNGANSTASNTADGLLNVSNVGNLQGNNTSAASNLLCGSELLTGNRIYLFQDAPASQEAAPGDLCETNQNNGSTNSTGSNSGEAAFNVNNVANLQGNNTSVLSNLLCGARLLSGNTIVLFGNAPASNSASTSSAQRCQTTQGTWKKNSTGSDSVAGLLNVSNVGNLQGNNTSVGSNVLCDADILSGNTIAIGGGSGGSSTVNLSSNASTGGTSSPTQCVSKQQGTGTNHTGPNVLSSLLNLNDVGNLQGEDISRASNLGCGMSLLSGGTLSAVLGLF